MDGEKESPLSGAKAQISEGTLATLCPLLLFSGGCPGLIGTVMRALVTLIAFGLTLLTLTAPGNGRGTIFGPKYPTCTTSFHLDYSTNPSDIPSESARVTFHRFVQ